MVLTNLTSIQGWIYQYVRGYNGELKLMWGPLIDIDRGGGRSDKVAALGFASGIISGQKWCGN